MIDGVGMVSAGAAGPTLVVCSTSNPAYTRLTEMFKPDSNGFVRFFTTVQEAVTALVTMDLVDGVGSRILVAPGSYAETVTIPRTVSNVTIQGLGGKGAAAIAPSTAAAKALVNSADDVTLINMDLAGNTSATSAVISSGSRLRLIGCKLEGVDTSGAALTLAPGSAAAVTAGTAGNCGDIEIDDCTFCWSKNGIELKASDYGVPTQVVIRQGTQFHNIDGTCILATPGAFGVGCVRNLEVTNCVFDRMEDGTKPSDFVKVDGAADTGVFSMNTFAIATNASADLKIGAGVLWVANLTEAGVSAARPA